MRGKEIRITIVDRFPFATWYSWDLVSELSRLLKGKGLLFLYGPKERKYKISGDYIYRAVWSSYLYPFQIVLQAVRDRVKIIHIQFEFVTFGSFYTSPLVILLLLILRFLKIRTIVTLHGPIFPKNVKGEIISSLIPSFTKIPSFLFSLYVWSIYKFISKLASAVVVHAKIFGKWLAMFGIHNYFIIPHGVNVNLLHNEYTIVNKRNGCCEKTILYFGVLSPRKGLETLLQAFSIVMNTLPDARLIIAGDEPTYYRGYREKLIDISKRLGVSNRVSFLGRILDEEIGHLFQRADLIVLPYLFSISASGPLSLAMTYGKPVVVSRTELFEEILGDQCTSVFFPPRDYRVLAQRIVEILSNKECAEQISRMMKEKAVKFSWNSVALLTLELYEKLLNKRNKNC